VEEHVSWLISLERIKQDNKWGGLKKNNHSSLYWLGILMEEVGELSKSIIEGEPKSWVRGELVQVAAVAKFWLECMESVDRGEIEEK